MLLLFCKWDETDATLTFETTALIVQTGWTVIVQIYNMVVQCKIVGLNPWLLLLYLVSFVNFVVAVFAIMVLFKLAKLFRKNLDWGFGLWLLPFIFNLILALGLSEYVGPNG